MKLFKKLVESMWPIFPAVPLLFLCPVFLIVAFAISAANGFAFTAVVIAFIVVASIMLFAGIFTVFILIAIRTTDDKYYR